MEEPVVAAIDKEIEKDTPTCIAQLIDNGNVKSHRFFLARRTLFEMLSDRGYDVPTTELTRSLPEFRAEFGDDPDILKLRFTSHFKNKPASKILVIFCGTEEMKKANTLLMFSQIMNKESLHKIILVLQNKMNHYARKLVEEFSVKIETFQITDLLVNITKHALSPKLEVLTVTEKERLLKKYELQDQQMPRIQENDAVVRYYGLKRGQVIKVSYDSGITKSLVTYRCVMN